MLDPKPFVERAAAQAETEVLAWARARQRLPGAALATPGLLCAIADGLVFVVDDVVGPGEVTLLERSAIERVVVEQGALDAVLRLETSEGPIVFEDLRPEELRALEVHGFGATAGARSVDEPYPSAVGLGVLGEGARSWMGEPVGAGDEPWVPGSYGVEPSAAIAGGSVGERIARDALRARLVGLLADRAAAAQALRQSLLATLSDAMAVQGSALGTAEEMALRRAAPPDVRPHRRQKRPAAPSPAAPSCEPSVAEPTEADAPPGAPSHELPLAPRPTAPAQRRPGLGSAVWLLVALGALPGLWLHPSVALFGAIVGFVIASSWVNRSTRRAGSAPVDPPPDGG